MKQTLLLLLAVCSVTACASMQRGPRMPQLSEVREFRVPWTDAFPSDVVVDDDGRLWFTDRLHSRIGRFDPVTETFDTFPTPTPKSAPYGIIRGDNGVLWFGESTAGRIGRIDTRTGGITEYLITDMTVGGPHMVAKHGRYIWFTMRDSAAYGRFDPRTGESLVYRMPADSAAPRNRVRPYSMVATADRVWFNSFEGRSLYEVDPASGAATRHNLSAPPPPRGISNDSLRALTRSSNGVGQIRRLAAARGTVWFTDYASGTIRSFDPQLKSVRTIEPRDAASVPYGLAVTSNGLVWFAENGKGRLVVVDPASGARTHVELKTRGGMIRNMVVDEKRGRAWLPMSDRGIIGLVEYR